MSLEIFRDYRPQGCRFLALGTLLLVAISIAHLEDANAEDSYEILNWNDLDPEIPELEALRNGAELSAAEMAKIYEEVWDPKSVVEELDGKKAMISGFVVPLEFNQEQEVTQFFLVPYHGACIHAPAPPPNQLILARHPEGFALDSLATAYSVSGEIFIQTTEYELGISSYGLRVEDLQIYSQ